MNKFLIELIKFYINKIPNKIQKEEKMKKILNTILKLFIKF
jgi:hypothetical protein